MSQVPNMSMLAVERVPRDETTQGTYLQAQLGKGAVCVLCSANLLEALPIKVMLEEMLRPGLTVLVK